MIADDYESIVPPKKTRNLLKKKTGEEVVHDTPRAELKRLVWQHKRWTNDARVMTQMVTDRTLRTGEDAGKVIKCDKDPGDILDIRAAAKKLGRRSTTLETGMLVQLRQLTVWKVFLSKVFGCGPVVGAYLLAFIDIRRATKPSQLIRYCGNATDVRTGRLERRNSAPKYGFDGAHNPEAGGTFNAELRTRLWQMFTAMRKNSAKATRCDRHEDLKPKASAKKEVKESFRAECSACTACLATARPFGTTSKYLKRWADAKHTHSTLGQPVKGATDGRIADPERKGRMKATDAFLEDLYMVLRASEGLDVWPTYATIKRGYAHGGTPVTREPTHLTLDDVLELVGDPNGSAATSFQFDAGSEDEEDDLLLAAE